MPRSTLLLIFVCQACVGPAAVRGVWLRASLPLKVSAVGASCYPATDAAAYWNKVVGAELFRVACVQTGEEAIGSDVLALPQLEGACLSAFELNGCAHRSFDQHHTTRSAAVWVNHAGVMSAWDPWGLEDNGPSKLEQVYRHELGHVLGLSHAEGTVMDAWREIHVPSDAQIDLLRRVYVPVGR